MAIQNVNDSTNNDGSFRGKLFAALVVFNNDPQKQCRIRVRIPELHREYADGDLPWAIQYSNYTGNGITGKVEVPEKGSWVWVSFLDDEGYSLAYIAGAQFPSTIPNELKANYPNVHGWIDRYNNLWKIDFSTGEIKLIHRSGTTIQINNSGNLTILSGVADINVTGNASIKASGNVNLHAGGAIDINGSSTLNIHGSGGVNINGGDINLNSGSGGSPTAPTTRTARATPSIPNVANQKL